MNIFIINSGSSSLKYQLFRFNSEKPVCSGLVERIGDSNSKITHKVFPDSEEKTFTFDDEIPDHESALYKVALLLTNSETGVIHSNSDIIAVGHRVVHGAEFFSTTTLITEEVKEKIKQTFELAPLHNPSCYLGIVISEKIFPTAKQIAVFDTAFHQSMPAKAFRFAIPEKFYTEYNIRAYGFHGTSHKYVSEEAAKYLEKPDAKIISVHLGNGCSITAIQNGKSIDTSMGFGPLSGLIMGTRSGDIDPTVLFYLVNSRGYSLEDVSEILNKKSGMLGLTGSGDMRDITKARNEGAAEATLAYDMYAYRIRKYIGSYVAALNGIDALIFTAGVGENDKLLREMVCADLDYLGITIDRDRNNASERNLREINLATAKVKILVIPTNEELEIAKQCYRLLDQIE